MFGTWGSMVYRRRWLVTVVVLLASLGAGAWGSGVFGKLTQGGYEDPASQSAQADRMVEQHFGRQQGDVMVLYSAPPGGTVDDPAVAGGVTAALRALPRDAVAGVLDYWDGHAAQLVDADHTHALAVLTLAADQPGAQQTQFTRIRDRLAVPGVRADIAGAVPVQQAITERSNADLRTAELVSLPITLALLVVIFGSLVAALLPVAVGGLAILGSLGVLHLLADLVEVNPFAVNVASLLGLGLAIDYGLFSVGRFREELAAGRSPAEAVRRTVATASRTVAFSATLLVVALAGLVVFPLGFLRSVGYGGMSAVAVAAVVSLTLLPALLGLLGRRVDMLAVPWRRRASGSVGEPRGLARLAGVVLRRPALFAVPLVAGLLVLGAPFLGVKFGAVDEKQLPEGNPTRQAVAAVDRSFPASGNGSAEIVLRGAGPAEVRRFAEDARRVPGVRGVAPAGASGDVVLLRATLAGDPLGEDAKDAVRGLRAIPVPPGEQALVGGFSARVVDSVQAIMERLPWMVAVLAGATLVMMFLAFGSVLLPVKAVLMSTLSLCATFGVLVWVFQQGHGAGLLGVTPEPLEPGMIVLIGAIVFGLSTDYETFLLSRMIEARNAGMSSPEAVRHGLLRTGRTISAAALLLIVVVGAFGLSQLATMRFIGLGMIVALALDATVVRMMLVPAVLRLLGDAAWWAPGRLRRLRRRIGAHHGEPEPEPVIEERAPELSGRR
ncbi:MMPL family transporter [Gandjariella thermophila]|uniref:MMPL family transporter n=1 Tax=Gandjariella thermophila TaxID=1931992 RepID=UPI001CEF9587|nr:MMPL family transporter [Gandjariella thermophila]